MTTNILEKTSAQAETSTVQQPHYARLDEVQRLFGLAKGTIYNLLKAGRIRGCNLRVRGKKARLRLVDVASVRSLIEAEMKDQNKETTNETE